MTDDFADLTLCLLTITGDTGCVLGYTCGHTMCDECYDNWRNAKGKVCPECRALSVVRRGRPRRS